MAAKVISRPSEPVEPVFKVYGKDGGWFSAGELVERYAEWDEASAWLPLGFGSYEQHPKVWAELKAFQKRKMLEWEAAKKGHQEALEDQRKAEAKARWDRNKVEAARRMKK